MEDSMNRDRQRLNGNETLDNENSMKKDDLNNKFHPFLEADNGGQPSKSIWKRSLFFFSKNKKIIFIIMGILALLLAGGLLLNFLVFKSPDGKQPLIFQRKFKEFDKHSYIKIVQTCVDMQDINSAASYCHRVDANFSFYIANVTSSDKDPRFKNQKDQPFKFDTITALLHFFNLTYTNETEFMRFSGPNFDRVEDSKHPMDQLDPKDLRI